MALHGRSSTSRLILGCQDAIFTCMTDQAPPKKPKRPRDANELAKRIVDEATGQTNDDVPTQADHVKDPAAVSLGRRGGLKGGRARAERLDASQKSSIARLAAQARWGKRGGDDKD